MKNVSANSRIRLITVSAPSKPVGFRTSVEMRAMTPEFEFLVSQLICVSVDRHRLSAARRQKHDLSAATVARPGLLSSDLVSHVLSLHS